MPRTKPTSHEWMEEAGIPVRFAWNGGASYARPEEDEEADCIGSVLCVCQERMANTDGRTPCVRYADGDIVAIVWIDQGTPMEDGPGMSGEYPDAIVRFRDGAFVAEPA